MTSTSVWNNAYAVELPLHPGFQVYLPLVQRSNVAGPLPSGSTSYTNTGASSDVPGNSKIGVISALLNAGPSINADDHVPHELKRQLSLLLQTE